MIMQKRPALMSRALSFCLIYLLGEERDYFFSLCRLYHFTARVNKIVSPRIPDTPQIHPKEFFSTIRKTTATSIMVGISFIILNFKGLVVSSSRLALFIKDCP